MEATCRQVVGQRLKGSGRQWREAGAVALATLITYRMNGEWDVFWATASLARAGYLQPVAGCTRRHSVAFASLDEAA
jgi:hypothetical protein